MPHPTVHRREVREHMLAMTERLIAEYDGALPAGSVMRCVARCAEQLRIAGVDDGLVAQTEVVARRRLSGVIPRYAA